MKRYLPSDKLISAIQAWQIVYTLPLSEIELNGDELVIRQDNDEQRFDIDKVSTIIIFGIVNIEPNVQMKLLLKKVSIVYFDRLGKFLGRLEPQRTQRLDIIKAQAMITDERKIHIASRIVWAQLRNCYRFLQRQGRYIGIDLSDSLQKIKWSFEPLAKVKSVESVLGYYGMGMQAYYEVLPQVILNSNFEFYGRNKPSMLNNMLEFSYELLEQTAITSLAIAGLSPYHGVLHESYKNQIGLAADLATEFKLVADTVVLRLINRSEVVLKDFDDFDITSGSLPMKVREKLVVQYKKKMSESVFHIVEKMPYEQIMVVQAQQIMLYLTQGIEYAPMELR